MNYEELWTSIMSDLSNGEKELRTLGKMLWFRLSSDGESMYVDRSIDNSPSCNLSMPRKITKKDFLLVSSYYDRWTAGEVGIRHEVSRRSRNTAYIFTFIVEFGDCN